MFRSALSIADAVDIRKCGFVGCEACPFRVYTRSHHGCLAPGGASLLRELPALARLLGQDGDAVDVLLRERLEEASADGRDYQVASVEQVRELSERLDRALADLERVVEGPLLRVRPAWEGRVRAAGRDWIRDERVGADELRQPLMIDFVSQLELVAGFLHAALALDAEVEFDRYDFSLAEL